MDNAKILQTCHLIILGRPGHAHQDEWYQLVGQFRVYLHAKTQPHPSLLL